MYKFDKENHIHNYDGKPLKGTTTVIKEVLPPMLAWYGSGLACKELGWYDRKKGRTNYVEDEIGMPILKAKFEELLKMTPEEYLKELDKAYKAHYVYMKKRGGEGTDTHKFIEIAVKDCIEKNHGYLSLKKYTNSEVERFAVWGRRKCFLYSEVYVYSTTLWLGGQLDLVYEFENQRHIGDLKTSKSIYESAFIQAGLYDSQQEENGYYTEDGHKLGDKLKIDGYTVINLPVGKEIKVKTYYDTDGLKNFSKNIVSMHNILQELKQFIKT